MTRVRPLCHLALALLSCAPSLCPQGGVKLKDLPGLAQSRADRQRPALEKKLAPFWEDLQKDPAEHPGVHDKVLQVVKLGSSVVPLLLEKLEPAEGGPLGRNLARNCAAALAYMQPKTFLDALINIASGRSYTGQGHAITLLGMTKSPRAGRVLTTLLDRPRLDRRRRRKLILALTALAYAPAAERIAAMLPCDHPQDRAAVNAYLGVVKPKSAVPHLIRAIGRARRASTVMDYVAQLRNVVRGTDKKAAAALLPLLDGEKLDRMQLAELCTVLGTITPPGHEPTIIALTRLVSGGQTGDLELQAAVALKRLGDKDGPKALLTTLKKKVRGRNRRDYLHHNHLGDYYLAFDEMSKAVNAYGEAIRYTSNVNIQARLYIKIARAEARRARWPQVRKALRSSRANYQQLLQHGKEFPELAAAFKQDAVKRYLDSLKPKEKANGKSRKGSSKTRKNRRNQRRSR